VLRFYVQRAPLKVCTCLLPCYWQKFPAPAGHNASVFLIEVGGQYSAIIKNSHESFWKFFSRGQLGIFFCPTSRWAALKNQRCWRRKGYGASRNRFSPCDESCRILALVRQQIIPSLVLKKSIVSFFYTFLVGILWLRHVPGTKRTTAIFLRHIPP